MVLCSPFLCLLFVKNLNQAIFEKHCHIHLLLQRVFYLSSKELFNFILKPLKGPFLGNKVIDAHNIIKCYE